MRSDEFKPIGLQESPKNIPNRFRFDVESEGTQSTKVRKQYTKCRGGPAPDWTSPGAGPRLEQFLAIFFEVVLPMTRRVLPHDHGRDISQSHQ